jgi:hypothetical protein
MMTAVVKDFVDVLRFETNERIATKCNSPLYARVLWNPKMPLTTAKLTQFALHVILQHCWAYDQDGLDCICHCGPVDMGCHPSSIFERCLGLRSLWTFLVSNLISYANVDLLLMIQRDKQE